MVELLSGIEGVTCPEPEGAFYCFPSFEGLLGRTIGGVTSTSTLELASEVQSLDGEIDTVLTVRIDEGRITGLYAVRNPEKLARMEHATDLSR